MENYKKVLKKRICLLGILITFIGIGLAIYRILGPTVEIKNDFLFEFQCGIAVAFEFFFCVLIIRYRKILQDEETIKMQYNKENDERMKNIRAKAGMPMLMITSIIMIMIGVIWGCFNVTVFYVLILSAICQMLISCMVKLIYIKIM